jgi:hypothetical protein
MLPLIRRVYGYAPWELEEHMWLSEVEGLLEDLDQLEQTAAASQEPEEDIRPVDVDPQELTAFLTRFDQRRRHRVARRTKGS